MTRLEELIGPEEPKGARAIAERFFASAADRTRRLFAKISERSGQRKSPSRAPFAFFGRAKLPKAEGLAPTAPDPSKILFNSDAAESAADADSPLGFDLSRSAREIAERQSGLDAEAQRLRVEIQGRLDGEATLMTQAIRIAIVLYWTLLALSLSWIGGGGEVAWAPAWLAATPASDAAVLARVFAIVATAGALVAFSVSAIVYALGKGTNKRLRAKAARLGGEAGEFALAFDAKLDRLRSAMDRRQESPAEALVSLSRAHLTALEAAVFFRRIQFLTDADRRDAARKFQAFLAGAGNGASGGATGEAFLLGLITGAFAILIALPGPVVLPTGAPELGGAYPWAIFSVLLGAFVYVVTGLAVAVLRKPLTGPAERQARDEALDAVRSGFIARNAPLIDSVVQRIEDALEVFQARLSKRHAHAHEAGPREETTPAWRKAPEAPRFVEQEFQAAPKTFHVAAPADPTESRKKRRSFLSSAIPGADD